MELAPRDKGQVQAGAWDADAVQVEALGVVRAKAWVEWAALAQVPARADSVYVLHVAQQPRIRSARPVITSVALNAALK